MNCVDKTSQEFYRKMMLEGKVKINSKVFEQYVESYYRDNYDIDGKFVILMVQYEHFDRNYKVYDSVEDDYINMPKNRKVIDLLPFLITSGFDMNIISSGLIKVPGIIDDSELFNKVEEVIPDGIIMISRDTLKEVSLENGYGEPIFEHYFYSYMDYPGYNVFAEPIEMKKNCNMGDGGALKEEKVNLVEIRDNYLKKLEKGKKNIFR